MRRARVDKNQSELVLKLRELGFSVVLTHTVHSGFPDAVLGSEGTTIVGNYPQLTQFLKDEKIPYIENITVLAEFKQKKGKKTPSQVVFHENYKGSLLILRTVEDVEKLKGDKV